MTWDSNNDVREAALDAVKDTLSEESVAYWATDGMVEDHPPQRQWFEDTDTYGMARGRLTSEQWELAQQVYNRGLAAAIKVCEDNLDKVSGDDFAADEWCEAEDGVREQACAAAEASR